MFDWQNFKEVAQSYRGCICTQDMQISKLWVSVHACTNQRTTPNLVAKNTRSYTPPAQVWRALVAIFAVQGPSSYLPASFLPVFLPDHDTDAS